MQEMTLVHYWMAGVMLVMAVFGAFSLLGYRHRLRAEKRMEATGTVLK